MIRPFVLGVLLLIAPVAAAQPAADPAQEREARQLEAMVIAPCCWSQQVSVHQSPAADGMKKDIRKRLAAGQTQQQILDAFVTQYGEQILAEPPARGFKRTLYVLPVILFVLSAGVLAVLVKRMARKPAPAGAQPAGPSAVAGDTYDARLNDELRDLD
jgi:cytochrome c-type biogenesis protein CcmH